MAKRDEGKDEELADRSEDQSMEDVREEGTVSTGPLNPDDTSDEDDEDDEDEPTFTGAYAAEDLMDPESPMSAENPPKNALVNKMDEPVDRGFPEAPGDSK